MRVIDGKGKKPNEIKINTVGILLLISCMVLISTVSTIEASSQSLEEYELLFTSRQFVPALGVSYSTEADITTSPLERVHVLIQFYRTPNATEREALKDAGVNLVGYIPNNAWFVSIPASENSLMEIMNTPIVRSVVGIQPEDKMQDVVKKREFGNWSFDPVTNSVNLTIIFFKDVSSIDAEQIISRYNGVVIGTAPIINAFVVKFPVEFISALASEDSIKWIEEVPPPGTEDNDGIRQAIGVNIVQAPPYDLLGSGVRAVQFEPNVPNNTHADLGYRVQLPIGGSVGDHPTHVAGTLLGNGTIDWNYRGMAPNATSVAYECFATVADQRLLYEDAINNYSVDISTNSWGTAHGGDYDAMSQLYDSIVHGDITKPILIIASAGNRGRDGAFTADGYGSVRVPNSAKNTIEVGSTGSDDDTRSNFSSKGPAADGRVKPDVTAPGCENNTYYEAVRAAGNIHLALGNPDKSIWSTIRNATYYGYYGKCGTSMSTPAVAGSAALILELWRNTHYGDPLPSTIKALLIHTAVDLDRSGDGSVTKDGPDYANGYGKINVKAAVDTIRDDAACCNVIVENNISAEGEMDNYTIEVPAGTTELKVTLVWDDYPGDPAAAEALVNDLDLIVKDPNGVRKYPWTLDPSNPANAAERNKRDDLNNVEQVYVSNPIQGTWNITVNGTIVPEPIQNYSLVSSLPMKEEEMTDVEWSIEKGLCWLYQNQNPDGSWSNNVGTTSLAAISFINAGYNETDPTVQKAIDYILSKVQGDGSIYSIYNYRTYETSLGLLALVGTHNSSYNTTIGNAATWLKDSQWDEGCLWGSVNKDNWYYGGFGYGRNIRPDLSNTQFALMALDSVLDISKDDDLWDKAQIFLARTQMRQENVAIPDLGYTVVWDPIYNKYDDGGFVYYPGTSLSSTGTSYGSMTAAGIWSLRLCNVPTSETRVQAALDWHKGHYTWTQNPGMSADARRFQYYYYLAFSKALMMTVGNQTFDGHDWYADLSANLTALQHPDGHWVNTYTGHGSEGDPNVVTSYSILALEVRQIPTNIQRLSWLTFILHSNADLHVYDPLGRHVGKNYDTGGIDLEIPNATYTSNDVQNITIPGLETGNYRIVLIGTGTGEYTLNVTGGVGNDTVSEDSYTGNITEGEVHDAEVNVAMITWLTIHVEEPDEIDTMVQAATGTGPVYFIVEASEIEDLVALNESDLPEGNPIVEFPHGLFGFNITGLTPGQNVTLIITFPSDIPTTAQYWKYGPNGSVNNPQPERWYQIPMGSNDGDNIITIKLTDGGVGDDDGVANGVIVDQGGPGIPTGVARVPTLTPIGILALAGLLAVVAVSRMRRKR